jgi:hypothetical protein
MKTILKKTKFTIILLIGIVVFSSCTKKIYKVTWEELKGTQWKLYAIDDNTTGTRMILEPQDCYTCFTLTFDLDYKGHVSLTGISILNTINIQFYFPDPSSEAIVNVQITDLDEPFDGNLYCDIIRFVTNIAPTRTRLLLHTRDSIIRQNLIFHPLKPKKIDP